MNAGNEARRRAAHELRAAIRRTAVEAFGAVESHEPVEGYQVLTNPVLDDDLAGVRAALLAWRVAFGQMRGYAEAARAAGRSWDDVAAALDLVVDETGYRVPGEVAFGWLIEGRDPDPDRDPHWLSRPTARWTCPVCGMRITDRGPFEPHPDDREYGHHPACARRQAALRAYDTERGES